MSKYNAYNPKPFWDEDIPNWKEKPLLRKMEQAERKLTQKQEAAVNIVYNALKALHKQNSPEKCLYTIREVTEALNTSKSGVINLIKSGQLTGIKISNAENSPYKITFDSIIKHIINVNRN